MTMEAIYDEAAVERLRADAAALESAAVALRDSIQGSGHIPGGGVYVTHIAAAAKDALYAVGRLANVLDKAGAEIGIRSDDTYIDYLGERTPAGAMVRGISERLHMAAADLKSVRDRYASVISELDSLGQR